MEPVIVWNPIERVLWGTALSVALFCGLYFIYKGRKKDVLNEKVIMFGLSSLPFGFAFSLLFVSLQVLQIPGTLDLYLDFRGIYPTENPPFLYALFGILNYTSLALGGMFFVFSFEIIYRRTKFLLTVLFAAIVVLVLVLPIIFGSYDLARSVSNFAIIPSQIVVIPIILYLFTKWSRLEFKAVSSFFFFGFLLLMISLILALRAHKLLNFYPLFLSPLLLIAGCAIIILPTAVNPRALQKIPLTYWVIFTVLTIPFFSFIVVIDSIIMIIAPVAEFNIVFIYEILIFIVFIYVMVFLTIRNIRSELRPERINAEKEDKLDILSIFTRPQNLTEEDISFYRENKICLVCKSQLTREIYLCPECDVLYCTKCVSALVALENACWSCFAALDPKKPVKLQLEEKEKLKIVESENIGKDLKIRDNPPDS